MEDLAIDELKQILNFYKQRSYDLEMQVLQLQIRLNKALSSKEPSIPATKTVVDKKSK